MPALSETALRFIGVNGDQDNVRLVYTKIFQPTPDNPVDFAEVEQTLLDLKKRYPNCTVVCDPYQMASTMQRLTRAGLKVEEFTQTPSNLTALTQNLYDLIRYERLIVFPDNKLRAAVVRTVTTENSSGLRIAKDRSHKTDATVALGMAALRCVQRHQTSVDLAWKYRAFDPNYVDPDAPPLLPAADQRLLDYYRSLDFAFRYGLVR
jgi:hypothetical protein